MADFFLVCWVSGFGGAIHNTTSEMTFLGFFLSKLDLLNRLAWVFF